jgi:hypothetical protein
MKRIWNLSDAAEVEDLHGYVQTELLAEVPHPSCLFLVEEGMSPESGFERLSMQLEGLFRAFLLGRSDLGSVPTACFLEAEGSDEEFLFDWLDRRYDCLGLYGHLKDIGGESPRVCAGRINQCSLVCLYEPESDAYLVFTR